MNTMKPSTSAPARQFLDPRSCNELLGDLRQAKIGSLPVSLLYFQLEFFLRHTHRNYSSEVGAIPQRLLEHNLSFGRSKATSEMLAVDADIVVHYDVRSKKIDITFKDRLAGLRWQNPR